jgi:acetylornithine/succinyldiaminopimelate/putrescine aminotransferase
MVYGEYSQSPAVQYCKLLVENLPESLNKVYLVNSGTEATEGALKLVRRVTGRSQLISCHNAYHGNTMGSMSVMGFEERKQVFRPLIPDVDFITFNNESDLEKITTKTAGIILESIQGGAGFIEPKNGFLTKVKKRCDEVGALLIIDEIQPGFGRTGKLFGFENSRCNYYWKRNGWRNACWRICCQLQLHGFTESRSKTWTYYYFWRTSCHSCCMLGYTTRSD